MRSILPKLLLGLLVAAPALAGCIETPGAAPSPAGAELAPIELPETITELVPAANVEFGGGNDLAFRDHYAYVASFSGTHIIDIADPANPRELAVLDCKGKDIGVVDTPKGRIVTISYQTDDGCPDAASTGGIRLVNVTDPANPVVMGQVPLRFGSHTHTPYGDTGLIYNSAYDLANPYNHHRSEIIDIRDPADPKVAGEFMFPMTSKSHGCHDILAEPERNRAICGGITETMIWDTTDPLAPKVVSTITDPLINIHHSAATARDGKLLILGDEYAGVLAPACHPVGKAPTGALWFYDISDAASPKRLGYFPPPAGPAGTVCTAHNFNTVADRDLVVSGFYSQGTLLVDFSDPASPKLVSQQTPGGSSWASYYYNGAVYSGDGVRGLDVYLLK